MPSYGHPFVEVPYKSAYRVSQGASCFLALTFYIWQYFSTKVTKLASELRIGLDVSTF